MSKKRTLLVLLCILCLAVPMLTTGCGGSSEKISQEKFEKVMKEYDMTVDDQTDTAGGDISDYVGVAYIQDQYQFEYYAAKDSDKATKIYEYLKGQLEEQLTGTTKSTTKEVKTNCRYMRSNENYYCVVIQNDNVVVYMTAAKDQEDKAKEILKELEG